MAKEKTVFHVTHLLHDGTVWEDFPRIPRTERAEKCILQACRYLREAMRKKAERQAAEQAGETTS